MKKRTIREAYLVASSFLEKLRVKDYKWEAELLLRHLLSFDRTQLFTRMNDVFLGSYDQLDTMLNRRMEGEPLQYILGETEFYGRRFYVDSRVLIPRPETELLIEKIIELGSGMATKPMQLVEVGTGSGVIAITLALRFNNWKITASDISQDALEVAKKNARLHGVEDRILWSQGEYLSCISSDEEIDICVSNPPYIPSYCIRSLDKEVRGFEPTVALDGGSDGTDPYVRILSQLSERSQFPQLIGFEIGYDQGKKVSSLLKATEKDCDVFVYQDLNGLDRVVIGKNVHKWCM